MARINFDGKTREQVARELLARLERGPQYGATEESQPVDVIQNRYRGWVHSWILTDLCRLIPELRDQLNSFGYYEGKK
jgi:hypothetical protein